MSESKDQNKKPAKNHGKPKHRSDSSGAEAGTKSNQGRAITRGKVSPIPELTILPLRGGNFPVWKDTIATYFQRTFRMHGLDLIRASKRTEYAEPKFEATEVPLDVKDKPAKKEIELANELARDKYKIELAQYWRDVAKYKEDNVAMYSTLWGQLSDESQTKIRNTTKDFDARVEAAADALLLWEAICRVHLANITGCSPVDKENARNDYQRCTQGKDPLEVYKRRFDGCIDAMRAVGIKPMPSEEDQAVRFMSGLDPARFADLISSVENDANREISEYPATVLEVLKLAETWRITVRPGSGFGAAVFNTTAHNYSPRDNSHTKSDNNGNAKKPKDKKKGKPNESDSAGKGGKREPKCNFCLKLGHYQNQCPEYLRCRECCQKGESPSAPAPSVASGKINMVNAVPAPVQYQFCVTSCGQAFATGQSGHPHDVLIDPTYREYLEPNGGVVVKLHKALYGCVESGKLWYDKLSSILLEAGFTRNPYEKCVFNMDVRGDQLTVAVYVDDLLVTCKSEAALDEFCTTTLPSRLNEVKVKSGRVHSFLGMTLDFSTAGEVALTMSNYICDMLDEFDVIGEAATPALDHLFDVRADSPLLPADKKKSFHRFTAMLLYTPRRCRPDISVATAFLSTRVLAPTEDDWAKLDRVMKYLNGTRSLGIRIKPRPEAEGPPHPDAYVDASYGVHPDGRSHTGCMITLGSGPVYIKSVKQKINTKSSTESELVALSDSLGQILWSRYFLEGQQYNLKSASTIHQDNLSTIALANNGQSNSERTRHINIRYFFIKDRIDAGEVKTVHAPTDKMYADILTKPLQGNLFRLMRKALMNWEY